MFVLVTTAFGGLTVCARLVPALLSEGKATIKTAIIMTIAITAPMTLSAVLLFFGGGGGGYSYYITACLSIHFSFKFLYR